MANVQIQHGYTKIANKLIEAIYKKGFPGNQTGILLFVLRRTYGWGRKDCQIKSLRGLAMELEKDPRGISKAFNFLLATNVLIHICEDMYRLNKDYDKWEPQSPGTGVPKNGDDSSQKRGQEFPHINKEVKERKKERKKTIDSPPKDRGVMSPIQKIVEAWKAMNEIEEDDVDFNKHEWTRVARRAKELLIKFNGDTNEAIDCMEWVIEEYREKKGFTVVIETVVKHVWTYKNRDITEREEKRNGYHR